MKIQQKVLWSNLFLYLSPLIAITVHSYIFDIENLLFFVDLSDTFRELVSSMPVSCAFIITIAWAVWNLSPMLPNNYQYADTDISQGYNREHALRLFPSHRTFWNRNAGCKVQIWNKKCCWLHWSKFVVHIEYAEHKYRNFPAFFHIEHKTIIYMQAFALVLYTWAENTAIYLFENRIWHISSCYAMENFASLLWDTYEDWKYMNNAFKFY